MAKRRERPDWLFAAAAYLAVPAALGSVVVVATGGHWRELAYAFGIWIAVLLVLPLARLRLQYSSREGFRFTGGGFEEYLSWALILALFTSWAAIPILVLIVHFSGLR